MKLTSTQDLIGLAFGYRMARCLHAAVDLGVADAIGETTVSIEDLARATGCHQGALYRLLMTLAAGGVFLRQDQGFAHTDVSRTLRADHPNSMAGFVRFTGADYQWEAWGGLADAVKTGETAFNTLFGCNSFEYYERSPEHGRIFDQAMSGFAPANISAVIEAYDFSKLQTVADIGGGRGHLLRAILATCPQTTGIVFDLPEVAARAPGHDRLRFIGGDFFSDALPVADAYLLMMILHDWSDEDCVRLLKNLRRRAPPHAKVLVIESVLENGVGSPYVDLADITMLVLTGGQERTQARYGSLFEQAGFRLEGAAIPTRSVMSVLQARPV